MDNEVIKFTAQMTRSDFLDTMSMIRRMDKSRASDRQYRSSKSGKKTGHKVLPRLIIINDPDPYSLDMNDLITFVISEEDYIELQKIYQWVKTCRENVRKCHKKNRPPVKKSRPLKPLPRINIVDAHDLSY